MSAVVEHANAVYGSTASPRFKWKCQSCTQRNDHRLMLPLSTMEVFVCRRCKRASTFTFTQKDSAS